MGSSVARSLILIYKSGGLGWLKDVCLSGRTYYAKKIEIAKLSLSFFDFSYICIIRVSDFLFSVLYQHEFKMIIMDR